MPPFWKRLKEKQPSADPKKDTGIHLSAKPDFPTVPNESVPGLSLRQTAKNRNTIRFKHSRLIQRMESFSLHSLHELACKWGNPLFMLQNNKFALLFTFHIRVSTCPSLDLLSYNTRIQQQQQALGSPPIAKYKSIFHRQISQCDIEMCIPRSSFYKTPNKAKK
ncbi:hypothetical protein CI102_11098 [Trichoderma harzianum]|nr:hypothetical protein CI102_11098 [Trichoderma harzianum]